MTGTETVAVGDVIACAESARANGRTYLARELLTLAEEMLADVDHEGTALSRLALAAVEASMPAFVDVSGAAAVRVAALEGGSER